MTEELFSWVRAFEEGRLTEVQWETLQAVVDNGDARSLLEAAQLLDFEATAQAGGEPRAY